MTYLLESVIEARRAYGPVMSHDECARLCNAVAWKHRADGWGVNAKSAGTFGTLPNGVKIAHDILHHLPSNTLVDILTAAGAESRPSWNPVGPPQSPDRVFITPVDPISWVSSPTPGPSVAPPAEPVLTQILRNLEALEATMSQCLAQTNATTETVQRMEDTWKRGVPVKLSVPVLGRITGTVGG